MNKKILLTLVLSCLYSTISFASDSVSNPQAVLNGFMQKYIATGGDMAKTVTTKDEAVNAAVAAYSVQIPHDDAVTRRAVQELADHLLAEYKISSAQC